MKKEKLATKVLHGLFVSGMCVFCITCTGYAETNITYDDLTRVNSTVNADNIEITGGPVYFDQYKNGKVDINVTNNFTISNTPAYVKTGDVNVGNTLRINKGANLYISSGNVKAGVMDVSGYFSMDPSDGIKDDNRKIEAEIINLKDGSYFTAKYVGEIKADIINHGGSTFTTNKITAGTITMGIDGEGSYPSINANEVNVNNLELNKGTFVLGTRGETNAVLNVKDGYDNTGMQVYGTMNVLENGKFSFNSDIKKYNDPEHISILNVGEDASINVNNKIMEIGDLFLNNAKVNVSKDNTKFSINKMSGNGEILVNSLNNNIIINNNESSLNLIGSSEVTDSFDPNNILIGLNSLVDVVDVKAGNNVEKVTALSGSVIGETTGIVNSNGDVVSYNEKANEFNAGISEMASIGLMAWRAENNDMNKRLGELRNSNGEHGVWARMVRGESEYGSQSIKNVYNTYQLGYDEKLSTNDHWTVGAAISYTDAQSSFATGSGENTSKGLSFYGSYLGDNGEFVDLIAKYARLDNEFDVAGGAGSGDYSTNGYSFSAEFGKRNQLANDFYFEPQVELTYGRVADVDYVTSKQVKVSQDAMDSLVGRVGFAAGKNIKNGNVYVRASYLYDFDGETSVSFTNGTTRTFEEDLGGGWFEFGIGTNINLSDATYLYLDVEKTTGGEVDTNWQWNAGVRYSF